MINGRSRTVEITYYRFDVFSRQVDKGNPAAVIDNGQNLNQEQMLLIANKIGYSETIYILPSAKATLRLRFFSPGSEMTLCGHGTLAAVALWYQQQSIKPQELTVETLAGILSIGLEEYEGQLRMTMTQTSPQFEAFDGDQAALLGSLGLTNDELDTRYPIVYGSTGSWTLIVPVKGLTGMKKMVPNNLQFPFVLTKHPESSIHPICLETYHEACWMHGRHFSGANAGTVEDPVTGTASGVMGAYYHQFIAPKLPLPLEISVEQGQEMGRDGRVEVLLEEVAGEVTVKIKGQALLVSKELLKL